MILNLIDCLCIEGTYGVYTSGLLVHTLTLHTIHTLCKSRAALCMILSEAAGAHDARLYTRIIPKMTSSSYQFCLVYLVSYLGTPKEHRLIENVLSLTRFRLNYIE